MSMFPAHTRKFDGQVYVCSTRARLKSVADKSAESFRRKGWLARVVPYKVTPKGMTWFAVYVRKPGGKS